MLRQVELGHPDSLTGAHPVCYGPGEQQCVVELNDDRCLRLATRLQSTADLERIQEADLFRSIPGAP